MFMSGNICTMVNLFDKAVAEGARSEGDRPSHTSIAQWAGRLPTNKHLFEQIFRKVEPESFLYEFLNSGDPLSCMFDKVKY